MRVHSAYWSLLLELGSLMEIKHNKAILLGLPVRSSHDFNMHQKPVSSNFTGQVQGLSSDLFKTQ